MQTINELINHGVNWPEGSNTNKTNQLTHPEITNKILL